MHENSLVFTDLLKDLESILSTNENFMIGPWLESAKALSTNEQEKKQYEFNARNQITLWGPDGEILDYAGKQWSGLISSYYIPRWKMFFKHLELSLISGKKFNKHRFIQDFLGKIGKPFCRDTANYPLIASGDPVDVAINLFQKWNKVIL